MYETFDTHLLGYLNKNIRLRLLLFSCKGNYKYNTLTFATVNVTLVKVQFCPQTSLGKCE